jgi:hypothetical protein
MVCHGWISPQTAPSTNPAQTAANDKRHFVVLLTQVSGTWKVFDVQYGNKEGNLTDLLK